MNTKVWATGLRVPVSEVAKIRQLGWTRLRCTFGRSTEKSTSLTAIGDGHFLVLNQQILKDTGTATGDDLEVQIRAEDAPYGMEMPETMAEALALDPEANVLFQALTPGKKRNLIYLVGKLRSAEKQIRNALVINEHLKMNSGSIDFRILNEQLRLKA